MPALDDFPPASDKLYQALSNLLKAYRSKQDYKFLLPLTMQVAEQLLKLCKSNPDQAFGQLMFYKTSLPYSSNLIFNTALLSCLLCQRQQWNDTTCKQLICAALSMFAHQQVTIEHFYAGKIEPEQAKTNLKRNNKLLAQHLKTGAQQCWRSALNVAQLVHFQTSHKQLGIINKLNSSQQLVFLAATLALKITPNKRYKNKSWATALQHISQYIPPHCYPLIEPLLSYPGLYPPGNLIQDRKGQNFIVLSLSDDGLWVSKANNEPQSEMTFLKRERVAKSGLCKSVTSPQKAYQWWHSEWQQAKLENKPFQRPDKTSFRIDSPPQSLLSIQQQLNSYEPDIQQLTQLIKAEPVFAQHIQHQASLHARQKLPIKAVKHAVMMHGFERTNSILIQHALVVRLAQHKFPLQQHFIQFSQLAAQLAAAICKQNQLLVPEQAINFITFALSGLFTHALLKTYLHYPANGPAQHDLTQVFAIPKAERLSQHAITLAQAWQQEKVFINAIKLHNNLQTQATLPSLRLASLLGLTLSVAKQLYFQAPDSPQEQNYQRQALHYLQLDQQQLLNARTEAISHSHCYTPLD